MLLLRRVLRSLLSVIPAHAGIQPCPQRMGLRLRGDDDIPLKVTP